MKKLAEKICKNKKVILIVSFVLMILSFVGMKLTNINYDILVYLPKDIETVEGQNILTNEFGMGAYTVVLVEDMPSKDILKLESNFKNIEGVSKVVSIYDALGSNVPLEMLPSDLTEKLYQDNTDLLFVTFDESTSSLSTINAIEEMKDIANDKLKISGMSAMVLDTMNLSESEIVIYIIIAVVLCLLVLELSLDSYLVPILLLLNIGLSILFNLGSNIILGEISYITKALVAVLQLGVTTDFSIFLYHAYEKKKSSGLNKEEAMRDAIVETFSSVTGSSLTTIAGFLVLITMNLTLGKDLGLVMAKGVFLGVICVLTVFPSLLLSCDKYITKTKHKSLAINFEPLNKFVIRHHKSIFVVFLILLIPVYLANSKVDIYYKIDRSLPDTLDSIVANTELKEKFNIVSPEIILLNKDMKTSDVEEMVEKLENIPGIDFVLSFAKLVSIFESGNYQMMLVNSLYDIATDELNEQITLVNEVIRDYDKDAILAGEGPLMKDLVTISDEDFKNVNYSSIICILIIMVFVLKSISLPILLIVAIEFAIFMNMSVSYFGGVVLPFVAPIVLGTIQLGATIDYAILMTSNYLKNRESGIEKKEAILKTTNYCSNSIFVSGMCFFAATFGVGLYSELEMVGSLCALISRGAIISMIVVIMVLPSILLIFDKLILKTTYMKGSKKMNKKIITALFIALLAYIPNNVLALAKEESVYAKLNSDGSVKSILVNEHLINDEELKLIEDMTDLENIKNTHSNHNFDKIDNLVTWHSEGESIFYQGTTNKELPIKEVITYKLDDEEISLDDLIGKKGHVTITIKYENTSSFLKKVNGKNETLYTPFTIMTSTLISNENNKNVTINNGKIVDNGSMYIVVGLSVPGLSESLGINELKNLDTIEISYDTEKFELASIYSIATPKIIDETDLKIFDKLDSITSSVNSLQTAINQIEAGSKDLLNGANTISSGANEISKNLNIVLENLDKIKNGTISLDSGLKQAITSLESAKKGLKNNPELEQVKALIEGNKQLLLISPNPQLELTNNALEKCYYNLIDTTMIDTLIASLKQIENGASTLVDGTSSLRDGVSILNSKMGELATGTVSLKNGAITLNKGINEFNKNGIGKLVTMANSLKATSNKVNAIVDLGKSYQTFALSDNKVTANTKFIMIVDGVKAPKEETNNNKVDEKLSFFDRLKNLFK